MTVYFASNGRGQVKIGHTTTTAENRLQGVQTGSPHRLTVIRTIDAGPKTELWLHRRFARHRLSGEWFEFTEEMLSIITPDELPVRRYPPRNPTVDERCEINKARTKLAQLQQWLEQI